MYFILSITLKPRREFKFGVACFSLTISAVLSKRTDASHPYFINEDFRLYSYKEVYNKKKNIYGNEIDIPKQSNHENAIEGEKQPFEDL